MCWGFDHGDGWFEIIWQLSLAIEEELGYSCLLKGWFLFKKSFFGSWNAIIYKLSPPRYDKRVQEGSGTSDDPYRWTVVEKAPADWLARMASKILTPSDGDSWTWCGRMRTLGFKAFVRRPDTGLAVQQVREKYGTLRFYCSGTDAICRYIRLAERLSAVTCEDCGEPGAANSCGWISTLCEQCRTARKASALSFS